MASFVAQFTGVGVGRQSTLSEPHRGLERCPHRCRIGATRTGDIEGGAMVGRRAWERQAQRDVNGRAEGSGLDGRHPHVVVGCEHGVRFAAHGPDKDGVGGVGAISYDAFFPQLGDGRFTDARFLIAEQAVI
jgi:hypothetical protein